jgi:hypothetical protein
MTVAVTMAGSMLAFFSVTMSMSMSMTVTMPVSMTVTVASVKKRVGIEHNFVY